MTNNPPAPTTAVSLDMTREMMLHILKDQFAHLEKGELRTRLEAAYGHNVWDNDELLEHFEVSHFDPPYVHVIRKTDGTRGTVAFTDTPRLYFEFKPVKA